MADALLSVDCADIAVADISCYSGAVIQLMAMYIFDNVFRLRSVSTIGRNSCVRISVGAPTLRRLYWSQEQAMGYPLAFFASMERISSIFC